MVSVLHVGEVELIQFFLSPLHITLSVVATVATTATIGADKLFHELRDGRLSAGGSLSSLFLLSLAIRHGLSILMFYNFYHMVHFRF